MATSKGWPALFIGTLLVSLPNVSTCSAEKDAGIKGVQIGPGATPFTLIPSFINDCESDLVNATMAPFVEL